MEGEKSFYSGIGAKEGHDVSQTLERAHHKAEEILDAKRTSMDDFASPRGNYDTEMVERDKAVVAKLEEKFEADMDAHPELRELKHTATVLEAIICEQVKESLWFGGNSEIVPTTEYDDYVNGVDGILAIRSVEKSDFMALGIDVTFSSNSARRKLAHIAEEIGQGKMASVKYFRSPDGSIVGELNNIPRIVLGAEASTVIQMASQWVNENPTTFKRHWLQSQLLSLAVEQCEGFKEYAMKKNQGSVAGAYNALATKLKSIQRLREKTTVISDERDRAHKSIIDELGGLVHSANSTA